MFLVSGGNDNSYNYHASSEIFDPDLGSWKAGTALPSSMAYMREANTVNRVLIFGIDILLWRIIA